MKVLKNLSNGANLMEAGVIRSGNDLKSFGHFKKDQVAAVNLSTSSSAVAVGAIDRDSMDMYMSAGRGICVRCLHVFGDKLWSLEPTATLQLPISKPVIVAPKLSNENDFPALGSEPPPKKVEVKPKADVSPQNDEASSVSSSEKPLEPAAMTPDETLKLMFLRALKSNKKELLTKIPLMTAIFYPTYVLKEAENSDNPIAIKNTTYKKTSTFFKQMAEEGFIIIREETKGVEKITDIKFDHPELNSVVAVKQKAPETEPNHNLLLNKMTELHMVNEDTKEMFAKVGVQEGTSLDSSQVKNYVKDYASRNKLINTITKDVILDSNLKSICGVAAEAENFQMKLDHLIDAVTSKMTIVFEMRGAAVVQAKGGKRTVIQMTIATRSGNKKVTMIRNLDCYGINMTEFSKACKIGVQASTSITKIPGTNLEQFQIQGNQVKFIHDLLIEKFGVAKGNITGLEFAKKEKKEKKK